MPRVLTHAAGLALLLASCATTLPSRLSQNDFAAVIADHKEDFTRCVREQWERAPGSAGTMVVRWNIFPDGTTAGIEVRTATYLGTPFADCVTAAVAKFHFPAYSGPQMDPIDFPLNY